MEMVISWFDRTTAKANRKNIALGFDKLGSLDLFWIPGVVFWDDGCHIGVNV